jgi:hypothetical protein
MLELGPSGGVMRKPFAKFSAGRDLFQPKIDFGLLLGEASWPEPIDEDAGAVVQAGLFVNAFYSELGKGHILWVSRR